MLRSDGIEPTTPEEAVALAFFGGMGPDLAGFKATYERLLHDDAVWETAGLPPRVGRAACVAYLDDLHARTGMDHCQIVLHGLASRAGTVHMEREDSMHRADGTLIMAFRIAGVVVVDDGRIRRYTDYCDLRGASAPV